MPKHIKLENCLQHSNFLNRNAESETSCISNDHKKSSYSIYYIFVNFYYLMGKKKPKSMYITCLKYCFILEEVSRSFSPIYLKIKRFSKDVG